MMLEAGEYRVWLRICQFQSSEVKEVLLDGKPIGAIRSGPRGDGYTEFKSVGDPVRLARGKHTLRVICRGIVGWIDPIQWIYVTRNLDADPRKREQSHEQTSTPRKPGL